MADDDQPEPEAQPDPDPDQAWKALSLVNDWVRHAETKIVAILAAAGVSGGLLYNVAKGWKEPSLFALIVAHLAVAILVATGWGCAMGLVPRRTARAKDRGLIDILAAWRTKVVARFAGDGGPGADGVADGQAGEASGSGEPVPPEDLVNLLFYSDIVKHYGEAGPRYREVLASLTSDRSGMTEHVAQQVWANASVTERKYNWANRALIRLLISWVLLAVLSYARVIGW